MLRTKLTLSTLAATIVLAGCSTQMTQPTQKDVSATKVEAVKVDSNVVDLGNKNGASIKVNVSIPKPSSPFGIKAISQGFIVDLTGSMLELVLYKQAPGPKSQPEVRHNAALDGMPNAIFRSFVAPTPGTPLSVTFKGLTPAAGPLPQDYYVSARVYSAQKDYSTTTVDLTAGGNVSLNSGPDFARLQLAKNDIVQINATKYRVSNIINATQFDVMQIGGGLITPVTGSTSFMHQSNLVATGDIGDSSLGGLGQGLSTTLQGGGTAGAIGDIASIATEEVVKIAPTGFLTLAADGQPSVSSGNIANAIATPNQNWDVLVQIRGDKKASVDGRVDLVPGAADTQNEDITL